MFSGERKINLGGRSSKGRQGRDELLAQSRAQRAQREDSKIKNKAAITLQAAWRATLDRNRAKNNAREQFDALVKPVIAQVNTKTENWMQNFVILAVRATQAKDLKRTLIIVKIAQTIAAFQGLILSEEYGLVRWSYLWRNIWKILLDDFTNTENAASCLTEMTLLLWFIEIEKWNTTGSTLITAHYRILSELSNSKNVCIFNILRNLIITYSSDSSSGRNIVTVSSAISVKLAKRLSGCLVQFMRTSTDRSMDIDMKEVDLNDKQVRAYLASFVQQILSIPLIVERWKNWRMVNVIETIMDSTSPLWNQSLSAFVEYFDGSNEIMVEFSYSVPSIDFGQPRKNIVGYESLGCLFGNLLQLGSTSSSKDFDFSGYVAVLDSVLQKTSELIFPYQAEFIEDDIDEDDDLEESKAVSPAYQFREIDEEILSQFKLLLDPSFLNLLASGLIGGHHNVRLAVRVSSFLNGLLNKWLMVSDQILNSLVLSTELAAELWRTLRSSGDLDQLLLSRLVKKDITLTFSLFCKSYRFLLSVVDDDELHSTFGGFEIEDHALIASFFNKFLHQFCWNDYIEGQKLSKEGVLDSAIEAYKELHERQSRWRFTNDSSFLMDSIDGKVFENEFTRRVPRSLTLMSEIPFVVRFEDRVRLFYHLIAADRESFQDQPFGFSPGLGNQTFTIRRTQLLDDAFTNLYGLGKTFKRPIRIEFINDQGMAEAGIDGGGLFKEFLTSISDVAFTPQSGLFCETSEEYALYPNPLSGKLYLNHLNLFCFLGMIVGKAIYENVLIEPRFANFFLRKMLGKDNTTNDLVTLDPVLYKNLMGLKRFPGDVRSLSLNFVAIDGDNVQHELISGGTHIAVAEENKLLYIRELANFRLNRQLQHQSHAFLKGLACIIDPAWLRMFSAPELQLLIAGSSKIDVSDWRANSVYTGGYTAESLQILWFWEIVNESSEAEKKSILQFCTSCSRAPLLGFKVMNPNFGIQRSGGGIDMLPTSSTCVNLLKLPAYPDKITLTAKLLYAAKSNSGFDLT